MAKDFMAQMLDELMGRNRNAAPNEKKDLRYDDPSVCKHFLACYCPNELFTNTKADLGICKLIHDDDLKEQYQKSPQFEKLGYEDRFIRFLKGMIQEVDRKIERGKSRLDANKQNAMLSTGNKYDEKIRELSEQIESLVKEAEQLGFQGRVDEAQKKLRESDQMRKERDTLRQTLEATVQQEKQLEVCMTCGAFLIVGDAQQRIDDRKAEHLQGKQHVGYAKIRETVAEEEAKLNKKLEERRQERAKSSSSRARSTGVDEERRASKMRERSRSRQRSRRSRSRERSKRRRSRSPSSKRRRSSSSSSSGSRDRRRRRHASPSSERKRKRRSRSRDERRRRKSRSRSREASRSSKSKKDEKKRRRRRSSSSSSSSSSGSSPDVRRTKSQNRELNGANGAAKNGQSEARDNATEANPAGQV